MMLAREIPVTLESLNVSEIKGDVYTIENGEKIPLDFLYVDDDGDLIFTQWSDELYKSLKKKS